MKLVSLRYIGLIAVLFCGSLVVIGQSADRAAGVRLFNAGDFSKAVDVFKKVVKSDDKDAEAWYMLGGSYLKMEKYKDAAKALKRATQLAPQNDVYKALLAYVYLTTGDYAASATASEALKLNQDNAEAHFVLGMLAYRNELFSNAYDRAKRAVQLKPAFTGAYRLKAQALIGSYMALDGKVLPPAVRADLLPEALADLDKYLALTSNTEERKEIADEVANLRAIAEYYSRPENRVVRDTSIPEPPDPTRVGLKIISKPRASYTDGARQRNVQGTVVLLIRFDALGRIGPIVVIKSLDRELDRNAIAAASRIKFKPETRNGVPVTVYKRFEYGFAIY